MMRDLLAAALLAAAVPATASTFVRLEVPDLARLADRGVISGRVLAADAVWNAERTMIWTEAAVLVREDLAGGELAGRTLRFRIPGGTVGDTTITMQGAPLMREGDEVVVFATTWPDGSLKVLGYLQGLSSVVMADDGRPRLLGGRADGLDLEAFREQVRAARAGR